MTHGRDVRLWRLVTGQGMLAGRCDQGHRMHWCIRGMRTLTVSPGNFLTMGPYTPETGNRSEIVPGNQASVRAR